MSNVSEEYQIKFNNRDGQSVNYDQLSSGERDVIAILFSLVEGEIESKLSEVDGSSPDESDIVILLDGPESHLHPKLQRELLHFLRELVDSNPMNDRDAQAIICTHSPTILDFASQMNCISWCFLTNATIIKQGALKISTLTSCDQLLVDQELYRYLQGPPYYWSKATPIMIF